MVGYRLVKYCRLCKQRFLINQGERIQNYCPDCVKRFEKEAKKNERKS